MAYITTEQWERVLSRLHKLEISHGDLVEATRSFITRLQVSELSVVFQTDIADLRERIEAIENRIADLEETPYGG